MRARVASAWPALCRRAIRSSAPRSSSLSTSGVAFGPGAMATSIAGRQIGHKPEM